MKERTRHPRSSAVYRVSGSAPPSGGGSPGRFPRPDISVLDIDNIETSAAGLEDAGRTSCHPRTFHADSGREDVDAAASLTPRRTPSSPWRVLPTAESRIAIAAGRSRGGRQGKRASDGALPG